jgi:hypothetical protein
MMLAGPLLSIPIIAVSGAMAARKFGIPWRRAIRTAMMAPAAWTTWWPRSLRRPGDVWDRLPAVVRRTRSILSGLMLVQVGGFPIVMYTFRETLAGRIIPGTWRAMLVVPVAIALVAGLVGMFASTISWRKRFSVSRALQQRLLGTPTWNNSFWDRPEIVRLLQPDNPEVQVAAPRADDARGLLKQIEALAAELPDGLAQAAHEAARAGRDVARFLDRADQDLKSLDRDVDPAERDRVAEKIVALGSTQSPMRNLLSQQLRLHDELEQRRRRLLDDRARGIALLKRVHLELSRSRAELARGDSSVATLSGQIRAACDDLLREREAQTEVEQLLATPTPT